MLLNPSSSSLELIDRILDPKEKKIDSPVYQSLYLGVHCPILSLAVKTDLNDETLKSLYWTGANYYPPLDVPDMSEGTWREAILRCLQCFYPQLMPELMATSVPELRVVAQSDQVCLLTSTYEPVGNREALDEDDSLPLLIPPSPLAKSSPETAMPLRIHPTCLCLSPPLPRQVGPSTPTTMVPFSPSAPLLALTC